MKAGITSQSGSLTAQLVEDLSVIAPKLWNIVPENIRKVSSIDAFKSRLNIYGSIFFIYWVMAAKSTGDTLMKTYILYSISANRWCLIQKAMQDETHFITSA